MAFLAKIRNSLKKRKNKNFRESVEGERSQKYLIKDYIKEPKRKKWSFFRREWNRLSPFSRFLGEKIQFTQDFSQRQQLYLKMIGMFLILASTYILVYSPYFLLSPSKVLIEAEDDGIDISIAYRAIEDLYGKNIFSLDEVAIIESIKASQKNISQVRIDRLYPNNIKILLAGYPVIFTADIYSLENKKWWMSENGILIPYDDMSVKDTSIKHIHIVDQTLNEDSLIDYREVISSEYAQLIQRMIASFETTWKDLEIENITYRKRENEVHIGLKNRTLILLTLQDFTRKTWEVITYKQLTLQFLNFQTFFEDHKDDIYNWLYTYIDARIPGRVFSCRERIICERNLAFIYPNK